MVKALLAVPGIDVNIQDGVSLNFACDAISQLLLLKHLLYAVLMFCVILQEDATAFMRACDYGSADIVRILLAVPHIEINTLDAVSS